MARRSDHSRKQIQQMAIQAAIAILSQEGLAGLSTRKVAASIGYTVGTLYLVFKNLDELLLHVNAATLDALQHRLQSARQAEQAASLQIEAMAQAYLQFARENYARWSLLYSHHLPQDMPVPDWIHDKVRGLFALAATPLMTLNAGLDEVACQEATRVLWSSVHGVCELGLSDKLSLAGEMQAEQLLAATISNYLKGFVQGWG